MDFLAISRWVKTSRLAPAMVALLGLAAGLQGCKEDVVKTERPRPVRVATVALEPLAQARRYAGVIKARYESDLGFRIAGKILERHVNVGDEVRAGQILARVDATDFKLSLEAQEAELTAAQSNRDQAVAAEARYEELNARGHVAQAALDVRRAAAVEARSRVERAERALEVQRNQVGYTELRADRDGVVAALLAEAGQVVAAGQTVVRLARLDELEAVVAVPEQKLDEVTDASAAVELWPANGKRYRATLREVSPEADPVARTFQARFSIPDPDQEVRLGKTATVVLTPTATTRVARLPLSAVINDGKGPMVWVVNASGSRIKRREVSIAAFTKNAALVATGLNPGERVVTLGAHLLDEGTPVRVVETQSLARAHSGDTQK